MQAPKNSITYSQKCMLLRYLFPNTPAFIIVKASALMGNPKLTAYDSDFSEDYQVWVPLNINDRVGANNQTTLDFDYRDDHIRIPNRGTSERRQMFELVHLHERRRTYVFLPGPNPEVVRVLGDDDILSVPAVPYEYGQNQHTLHMNLVQRIADMNVRRRALAIRRWIEVRGRRIAAAAARGDANAIANVDVVGRLPSFAVDHPPRDVPPEAVDEIIICLGEGRSRRQDWVHRL